MATHIINRLPTPVLNWKSPYELLFSKPPDLHNLKPFGCLAYATNIQPNKSKFHPRTHKCVFIGYAPSQKGYKLFSLETQQPLISRDVKFFDNMFPYSTITKAAESIPLPLIPLTESPPSLPPDSPTLPSNPPIIADLPAAPYRAPRQRKPPAWTSDYIVGQFYTPSESHINSTLTPSFVQPYPSENHPHYGSAYVAYFSQVSSLKEPTTYKEASGQHEWILAMKKELEALEKNNT